MSIKVSPEIIEQLSNEIKKVITEIEEMKSDITSGVNNLDTGWNDSKAKEFKNIMEGLVKLMNEPKGVLEQTLPKLNELKSSLEEYNNVKF
ncbi:WXG100 family type VII secretion target [uncultured Parvimonas sp.]|uniref:WXG100 family type VII secretion target n=1 Tax=uncultured Parvimonas sp. TaxID=747372 RepID=UPI00280448C4|nr:WXG100 family type VII secretion target [uncultured Parvimonas sp.]